MGIFAVDCSMRRRRRREYDAARCWAVARQCVLGLSLALACHSVLAQAVYRIKPLGDLGGCTTYAPTAAGLNKSDQVTGQACNAQGHTHAFLWKNDGNPMVDLGPPEVGSDSQGNAINASGVVAGYAHDSTGYFAFESSGNGTLTRIYDGLGGNTVYPTAINDHGQLTGGADDVGDSDAHAFVWMNNGSPMLDLGTFGGFNSGGNAINASGQVTGQSDLAAVGVRHAFFWKNDGSSMFDLGTLGGTRSEGLFINASGQIAGTSFLPKAVKPFGTTHAFFWRNDGTPMQDIGTLGGANTFPNAFNNGGQIAGTSYKPGNKAEHAFVWMNIGKAMKDLGTLGGTRSVATDINASGQVTGWADIAGGAGHAFLWRNDGSNIQDLNKLIDPTDPLKPYVTLTSGDFVNDFGDIVASGTDSRTGMDGLYLLRGTVLTLAPRSLAFGNQPIHTTSAAKSVTMTNTSPKAVAITSIALTGAAAGQFASTNNCGKSLAGHAACTIKVTFKPTTKGAKSEVLNVNGGGGGLRSVAFTGTGT
jgi:probable HAF family extracellular repeat protein